MCEFYNVPWCAPASPTWPFAPPCDVPCIGQQVVDAQYFDFEESQREENHAKAFLSSYAK